MSEKQKDYSEYAFQDNFVHELEKYRWKLLPHLDGTKHKVTVDDLVINWRSELNRLNQDQLEGVDLTDNEFKQVIAKVSQITNSYEASKLLAIEEGKGKIDGIYRDDNPKITRKQITLTIFKKAQVAGGDSNYYIAREVQTKNGNRFDIVLLINGLPLINIEQKRTDKTLEEAFGQFKRYYRDGEYSNNFMAFSQMMVITSEIDTRYFATPKAIDEFNPSFVFRWSDVNNRAVVQWQAVIKDLLSVPMAHQLVGDYLIIDEARDEENRRHMLMRPYQVHALRAIEAAAFGFDNEDRVPHGGFIWHTTGSGKTITSFKTALFLATRAGFDKVVFMVDRRELDNRTTENFKAYAYYEPVTVDDTKYTYSLKRELNSRKAGIVVTTTFKLNNLVTELNETGDNSLKDKRIVFIIDEAHRTTMGQMMGSIKEYFKKNGLFYGFTGTPLFDENKVTGKINENSEVINTTEKLFGNLLHKYTIDEAISDGNVLGFHVDYINTGEFISYESLRDKLIANEQIKHPDRTLKEIEKEIYLLNDLQVEQEAVKEKILLYHDDTHIPAVVTEILDNWETQSQNYFFNAILTVAYKDRVIAYYREFKRQLAKRDMELNIAMTFSFGNPNDPENVTSEVAEEMFADYESFTGLGFVPGDIKRGEANYFEDLISRATRGGHARNAKNIDLVIVADQLLTGYDSKLLNTLYVDRSLELQGLIQAYSRTNRVYGKNKEFGTIINFQYPKITEDRVNTALQLYGSGGESSKVIVDHYDTAVSKLNNLLEKMIDTLPNPEDWHDIKDDEDKKKLFMESYREANKQYNTVSQYYEYQWDDEQFGMTEHHWMYYTGAYNNLLDDDPIIERPESTPLEGKTRLAGTQIIDAAHIIALIGKEVNTDGDFQTVDRETLRIIMEQIQELSQLGQDKQAQLLKEFVQTKLEKGTIPTNIHFDEAFEEWKQSKQVLEIENFVQEWGLDKETMIKSVNSYSVIDDSIPYIEEITSSSSYETARNKSAGGQLGHNIKLSEELPKWLKEITVKYK